ncbi:MAG: DUF378 domain-containing protein [Waddliaceae bacterium]
MKILDIIATILLILGGLNWGILGLTDYNVINMIFGVTEYNVVNTVVGPTLIERIIYILFGLSAVWKAICYTGWCHKS